MRSTSTDKPPNLRRYLAIFASQLVLTGAVVLLSRLGGRIGMTAVMLVAAVNASLVAFVMMGVRRDGRLVSVLAVMTVLLLIGLLVWPAWDVAERARVF